MGHKNKATKLNKAKKANRKCEVERSRTGTHWKGHPSHININNYLTTHTNLKDTWCPKEQKRRGYLGLDLKILEKQINEASHVDDIPMERFNQAWAGENKKGVSRHTIRRIKYDSLRALIVNDDSGELTERDIHLRMSIDRLLSIQK